MPISRLDKLLEMLENQPGDAFLLYAVGFEYESIGNDGKAYDYYLAIINNHSAYLPVYYQAGLLQARMGETEKAIELLNKGIELAKSQNDKKTLRELSEALEDVTDQ